MKITFDWVIVTGFPWVLQSSEMWKKFRPIEVLKLAVYPDNSFFGECDYVKINFPMFALVVVHATVGLAR